MTDEALLAVEEVRHPMWTAPHPNERLTAPTRALRKEIARQLTRFDGRKDMQVPVAFCGSVYLASTTEMRIGAPERLLGEIVMRGAHHTQWIKRPKKQVTKQQRELDARDIAIIQDLVTKFTSAITKEVLS